MRFWDTSAVVPLVVDEASTPSVRRWLREDRAMTVWALTRTEAFSALCRRHGEGTIDAGGLERARTKLSAFAPHWLEVEDLVEVRRQAERLLLDHPLRAADALQLASAWHWAGGRPRRRELVVLDGPLREAGAAVGFTIVTAH